MKLNFTDRIHFYTLFPKSGDLLEELAIKAIDEKIKIVEDEIVKFGIKQKKVGDSVVTTWEVDTEIEVNFSEIEISFLKGQVDRLDKEKLITQANLDLCLLIKNHNAPNSPDNSK